VVGLGAGAIAAYVRPGQRWTFFEIDEGVLRAAQRHFTYLRDAPVKVDVVLGDARVSLAKEPVGRFRLLVLDAFSSDAVPTHLLTREAFALYVSRLSPHGVLAVHASNRYVRVDAVVADVARDLGLAARVAGGDRSDTSDPSRAVWVVIARSEEDLRALAGDARWREATSCVGVGGRVWTDDFSDWIGRLRIAGR
jgi:spermidine synthase